MNELRGWTRPRPIRVAFLTQDGELAASILDNIFSDCYRRWGGRFSMVVPCENGRIPQAYWAWLEHFDPDIVYSYVELTDADAIEIHERLSPASLDVHRHEDPPRYRPDYRFQPLQSLSAIFRLARFRPGRDEPLHILDVWQTDKPTRFLSDNFGTYMNSEGTGMYPADATPAADRLAVVSPEHQQKRQVVPQDLNFVSTELEAMKAIADRRALSMAQLSAQFAPKLNIRNGRWSGTFNLVIGDSYADRLLFWNARLLIPAWLDPNICCLRLDPAQLENAEFLEVLVHLLNFHNHVNGGAGGQAQMAVRSCSLTLEQLTAITEGLRKARLWGTSTVEVVPSPDAMIPNADTLSAAMEGGRQNGAFFSNGGWTQFVWTDNKARPPVDVPDHLADAPARQTFTTGHWAQEIMLELSSPGLRDENQWMLPRRWRMSGAFSVEYTGNSLNQISPATRADRFGRLTTFVSTERTLREIKVPTVRAAFAHAFVIEGLNAAAVRQHGGGGTAPQTPPGSEKATRMPI